MNLGTFCSVSRMLGLQACRAINQSYCLLSLSFGPGASHIFLQYFTASAPKRPFLFKGQHPAFSSTFCFLSVNLRKYKLSQARPDARGRSARKDHKINPTTISLFLTWKLQEQRKTSIPQCSKGDSVSQRSWTKRWIC